MMKAIVPCNAGEFMSACYTGDDVNDEYMLDPIVAWLIDEDNNYVPVPIAPGFGVNYETTATESYILSAATGKVYALDCCWDNIEQWLVSMREKVARKQSEVAG